jgi:hypothetical protein
LLFPLFLLIFSLLASNLRAMIGVPEIHRTFVDHEVT